MQQLTIIVQRLSDPSSDEPGSVVSGHHEATSGVRTDNTAPRAQDFNGAKQEAGI